MRNQTRCSAVLDIEQLLISFIFLKSYRIGFKYIIKCIYALFTHTYWHYFWHRSYVHFWFLRSCGLILDTWNRMDKGMLAKLSIWMKAQLTLVYPSCSMLHVSIACVHCMRANSINVGANTCVIWQRASNIFIRLGPNSPIRLTQCNITKYYNVVPNFKKLWKRWNNIRTMF